MVGPVTYDGFVDYMRSVGKAKHKRVDRVLFHDPPPDYWTGARLYRLQETVRKTDDWLDSLNWDEHPLPSILEDVWDYQWHDDPEDGLGWTRSLQSYMARHGHPVDQWDVPIREGDPISVVQIDAAARSFVHQWIAGSRLFTEDQDTTGSFTPSRAMSPVSSRSNSPEPSEMDFKSLTKLGIEEAALLPPNGVDPDSNPEFLGDGTLYKAELRCAKCLKSRGKTTIPCFVRDGLTACAECNRKRVGCSFVKDHPTASRSRTRKNLPRRISPEIGLPGDEEFEEWSGLEEERSVQVDRSSSEEIDEDVRMTDEESDKIEDSEDSEGEGKTKKKRRRRMKRSRRRRTRLRLRDSKRTLKHAKSGVQFWEWQIIWATFCIWDACYDIAQHSRIMREVPREPPRKRLRTSPEVELPSPLIGPSPLTGLSHLGPPSTEASSFPSPLSSALRPVEAGPGPSSATTHMQRVIESQGRTLNDQAGLITALQLELDQQRSAYTALQAQVTSLEAQNQSLQYQLGRTQASSSSTGKGVSGKGKDRAF
ncbi:uncharacterized protein C8Q71DRAFT_722457 [Rhodofomes roseus]|uniref:Zn(2)-C6 fungal-type domain-containing protein n=1 Tax=Rhodofomes roseus TaxID=34475 RepID=A0ABQ8KN88_9APHY|nr:uncharacterized protein C8Q71DRAFT_722457 [Rhodofomes roseus]KAH9839574.1 hypothetical protein C8Q71DRAFT_722457 [Rhodofomes roseus]